MTHEEWKQKWKVIADQIVGLFLCMKPLIFHDGLLLSQWLTHSILLTHGIIGTLGYMLQWSVFHVNLNAQITGKTFQIHLWGYFYNRIVFELINCMEKVAITKVNKGHIIHKGPKQNQNNKRKMNCVLWLGHPSSTVLDTCSPRSWAFRLRAEIVPLITMVLRPLSLD